MRQHLSTLLRGDFSVAQSAHAGLLHERYAPLGDRGDELGKIPQERREAFLLKVARMAIPSDIYRAAFVRWQAAMAASGAATVWMESTTRLLVGHGNPAPSEVGIALHPTYGVPYLPGTGLKGLLNHYLAEWGAPVDERWAGVHYEGGRPVGRPGEWHGHIFGEPNLPSNDPRQPHGARGHVIFEDAWIDPDAQESLTLDVVTPHQSDYYREFGGDWPNDWTDPVPVTFLTVPAGVRFLVAISPVGTADKAAADLALNHLADALNAWGVGAKGRAGYGRLERFDGAARATRRPEARPPTQAASTPQAAPRIAPTAPSSEAVKALEAAVTRVLESQGETGPSLAQRFEAEFSSDKHLTALGSADGASARTALRRLQGHAGLKKRFGARIDELLERTPK